MHRPPGPPHHGHGPPHHGPPHHGPGHHHHRPHHPPHHGPPHHHRSMPVTVVPVPAHPHPPPHGHHRHFFIRSMMNGKVLDVEGNNNSPGAKLVMWPQKGGHPDNQLFYMDHEGVIRSKMNHFALDMSSSTLRLNPYNPHISKQQWTFSGNKIINKHNHNEVLDIARKDHSDGAEICAYRYKGSTNQLWEACYV